MKSGLGGVGRERRGQIGAISISAFVVVGFLFLSRGHKRQDLTPLIRSVKLVAETVSHPAGVEVSFETSPGFRKWAATEYDVWEYRIRDSTGRILAVVEGNGGDRGKKLFVSKGYVKPIVDPRLEIWLGDELITSAGLPSFPLPVLEPLVPDSKPRLRAFLVPSEALARSSPGKNLLPAIRFEPTAPLAEGEMWSIEVLKTPGQSSIRAEVTPLTGTFGHTPTVAPSSGTRAPGREPVVDAAWVLSFPFADVATAVRVRVTRSMKHSSTEMVTIPGLHLESRGGRAVLLGEVPPIRTVSGVEIRLQPFTPPRPIVEPVEGRWVRRSVSANIRLKPGQISLGSEIKLISPIPANLGVQGMAFDWSQNGPHPKVPPISNLAESFAGGMQSVSATTGSVPKMRLVTKPFDAKFSFSRRWSDTLKVFESTVLVRSGS